ncbi:MAG TPA: hypothetical protein VHA35_18410 [Dongiaceae bacterium]|nr:hypothetical protein [Dongiaceae bacterium]
MASETRRITFTNEELVLALTRQRRDEKQPLPESRIRGAQVSAMDGAGVKVSVMLKSPTGDALEPLDIRPAEVGAALIKFCHLQKIPLPRRAKKSIAVDHGRIALVLKLP